MASRPLVAVPTTWIFGSAERISETRRRKKPESSTTNTLTTINTPKRRRLRRRREQSDAPRVALEHARHVENQGDASIAGDGRARHAGRALEHLAQWLDHHFLLTDQLIDDETDALAADRENHHMTLALLLMGSATDQPALEVEQRQCLVAHDHHFLAIDHVGARQVEVENLVDVDQRESEGLVAQHHHQRRHDRQGQRYLDDDLRALALDREHVDRAVELGNLGLHHVHADPAAGHIGDLGLGRETRGEDQVVAFELVEPIGRVLVQQALLHGLVAQYIGVHALAVVGNRQEDVIAFLLGRQHHLAAARLARGLALFRGFDAMVDGVAHQVHQRIGQRPDQVLFVGGFFFFTLRARSRTRRGKRPKTFLIGCMRVFITAVCRSAVTTSRLETALAMASSALLEPRRTRRLRTSTSSPTMFMISSRRAVSTRTVVSASLGAGALSAIAAAGGGAFSGATLAAGLAEGCAAATGLAGVAAATAAGALASAAGSTNLPLPCS